MFLCLLRRRRAKTSYAPLFPPFFSDLLEGKPIKRLVFIDPPALQITETVLSADCSESCTCRAAGGMQCQPAGCPFSQICGLKDGVRGCVEQPGQCTLAPATRFISFDGATGTTTAPGIYVMVSPCDSHRPTWFRLLADVSEDGDRPAVVALHLYSPQAFLTIKKDKKVWVGCPQPHCHPKSPALPLIVPKLRRLPPISIGGTQGKHLHRLSSIPPSPGDVPTLAHPFILTQTVLFPPVSHEGKPPHVSSFVPPSPRDLRATAQPFLLIKIALFPTGLMHDKAMQVLSFIPTSSPAVLALAHPFV